MNQQDAIRFIQSAFKRYEIRLTDRQAAQFYRYYEMLIETNQVMNLTAITEFEAVVYKHFIDSALLSCFFDLKQVRSCIDVGTGAGFPGIPLSILYPHISMCLMDSLNKRVGFLQRVIDELNLERVEAVHFRAEEGGRSIHYREQFDLAVSRAVTALPILLEYQSPFVKINGYCVAYKARDIEAELATAEKAIKIFHTPLTESYYYQMEGEERSLLLFKKSEKTAKRFPRKPGTAKKEPIM